MAWLVVADSDGKGPILPLPTLTLKIKFTTACPLPAAVWLSADTESVSYLLPHMPTTLHLGPCPRPCHYIPSGTEAKCCTALKGCDMAD